MNGERPSIKGSKQIVKSPMQHFIPKKDFMACFKNDDGSVFFDDVEWFVVHQYSSDESTPYGVVTPFVIDDYGIFEDVLTSSNCIGIIRKGSIPEMLEGLKLDLSTEVSNEL